MGKKITLVEARQRLGVSRVTMTRLVKEGRFPLYENPLDRRQKLVDVDELEAARQPRRIESGATEKKLAA
jgi:predicted site-specific integrase-resolvase